MTAKHYGSLYAMADYENKSHSLYFNSFLKLSDRVSLSGTVLYNKSEGSLDQVIMPDVTLEVDTMLSHQDFTFEEMHSYSDLEYEFLQLSLMSDIMISNGFTFATEVRYSDFADSKGYVFGDESGSLIDIRTGFRLTF